MSVQAKREYLQAMVMRYRQASRREKQRLLDECCRVTGYHRKYVVRRLNDPGLSGPPRARRRAATYSPAVIDVLAAIWEAAGYPWSLRLKALLPLREGAATDLLVARPRTLATPPPPPR